MSAQLVARRGAGSLVVLSLVAVGLLGCSPTVEPGATPTRPAPTASVAPATPTPVPSGEGEVPDSDLDVTIPECSSLITDEEAQQIFLPSFEEGVGPSAAFQEEYRQSRMGPAAVAALDEAVEFRSCVWGVPLSGLVEHLFVAELPSAVTQDIVAELRSSSYVESQSGDVTLFSYTFGDPEAYNWYGFSGDVWVGSFGQRGAAPIEAGFGNLRGAHPDWQPTAP